MKYQDGERTAAGGAAFLLALLLCAGAPAEAAEVSGAFSNESARMLVPVGHTVGIKLFSRGVVVVKLTDGGTPARSCGLRTGDVIMECGGAAVTSTEQFQSLLQESGGSETDLQVRRDGGSMTLSVAPHKMTRASTASAPGFGTAWRALAQ